MNINKHLDTECTAEISSDDVKIIQEIKPSPDKLLNNGGKVRENIMDEKNKKRKSESQAQQIKRPRKDSEEFRFKQ